MDSYDYVVIGAGSAGCVVAARLSEDPTARVLLIEGGGRPDRADVHDPTKWPTLGTGEIDWGYETVPQRHCKNRVVPVPRARMLGGCHSHNASAWVHGHPSDFDNWAYQGNPGWDYKSVLALIKRIENFTGGASEYRGASGPLHVELPTRTNPIGRAFIEAAVEVGLPRIHDNNSGNMEGASWFNFTIKNGRRVSVFTAILEPALSRQNLTAITHAETTKLLFEGNRCVGVTYVKDGRTVSARATTEVVLCAGVIGSPRILMLSGVGPADELRRLGIPVVADVPGVGKNLHDHILLAGINFEAPGELPPLENNGAESTLWWKSNSALRSPDLQPVIIEFPFASPELASHVPPNAWAIAPGLVRPASRGHVKLTSADPMSKLEIDMNYLAEEADVRALYKCVELCREIGNAKAFAPWRKREILPGPRDRAGMIDFIRLSTWTFFHPAGTCKMGIDVMAVVDPELRVRGIEGLRVADASIMPSVTTGNTNAPSVMIGEKVAEMIRSTRAAAATAVNASAPYAVPNSSGSKISFKPRYENFIGGKWVAPVRGQYMGDITPVTGRSYTEAPRSTHEDIDKALDAAHAAAKTWNRTSPAERSKLLLAIADRMEQNIEKLALAESWGNGKPIREAMYVDLPLSVDHWRYFAAAIRTQESPTSEIDENTVAYHFYEPLGVVGQIIPWNYPLLMATWKLAPALAAGNCSVIKPAEQTPTSILLFMEMIQDLLPPGVVNVVNGYGIEAGKPLAQSPRVAKVAFTGETTTGRLIMQYASENIVPVTLELGGKSPNIFFPDVFDEDDDFLDKAMEGFTLFAFNKGEICTCPSRAIVHEKIFDRFMEKAIARTKKIIVGDPLDMTTMVGPQSSTDQLEKILSYLDIGRKEGAELVIGGKQKRMEGHLSGGYYVEPTIFVGHNKMRIFQEEIFGPVVSVTKFRTMEEAIEIANDTLYGLAGAVWSRDVNTAYRVSRAIKAGRVFVNCYHAYPAHAAFGGYKHSGIGRESHKMMLGHYQHVKNVMASYGTKAYGFF